MVENRVDAVRPLQGLPVDGQLYLVSRIDLLSLELVSPEPQDTTEIHRGVGDEQWWMIDPTSRLYLECKEIMPRVGRHFTPSGIWNGSGLHNVRARGDRVGELEEDHLTDRVSWPPILDWVE